MLKILGGGGDHKKYVERNKWNRPQYLSYGYSIWGCGECQKICGGGGAQEKICEGIGKELNMWEGVGKK